MPLAFLAPLVAALALALVPGGGALAREFRSADVHPDDYPTVEAVRHRGEALRRRTHYVTTNAAGVRDYAPGDSFGRIHWPSTARRNRRSHSDA